MKYALLIILLYSTLFGKAQKDSVIIGPNAAVTKTKGVKVGTEVLPVKPRVAVIRSAIIPGWGQATNKKYWKIPLVYAALGTTSYLFVRNLRQYRDARDAYRLATDGDTSNDFLIKQPYFTVKDQPDRIRNFRNDVRQNVDYSALFFLLFWGLNVVDAAVDAHLRSFNVSDNLSFKIKMGHNDLAGTDGISLLLSFR